MEDKMSFFRFKSTAKDPEIAALAEELYRVMTLNPLSRDDALIAVDEARAAFCALLLKEVKE